MATEVRPQVPFAVLREIVLLDDMRDTGYKLPKHQQNNVD